METCENIAVLIQFSTHLEHFIFFPSKAKKFLLSRTDFFFFFFFEAIKICIIFTPARKHKKIKKILFTISQIIINLKSFGTRLTFTKAAENLASNNSFKWSPNKFVISKLQRRQSELFSRFSSETPFSVSFLRRQFINYRT